MLVHHFLEHNAQRFGDKPAVWFQGHWETYAEVEMRANQIAHFLVQNGIQKGDRVAILSDNSFEYIHFYYGILKAGGITVELNTGLLPGDIEYMMNNSESKAILVQKKYLKILSNITKIPSLQTIVVDQPVSANEKTIELPIYNTAEIYETYPTERCAVRCIDLDLASIVYTSGSTGKPKGVMLSHLNIVTNTRSIVEYLELSAADRIMVILPLFYVYGKSLLNTHFFVGGSVVMDNRFAFPNVVLKTMQDTRCTGFAGVPSTFSILLHKAALTSYRFPDLRYLTQAGGAMAPSLQKEVALAFYPAKLYIMYGATEASARLSFLSPQDLPKKWGSIGKAIPNVELFVANEEGQPLPPGEVGEIVARGANIMQGYWKDPEETAKVLRNGYYFTGDLGKMDEEGFIYVVGRSKDMIKVGANRVSGKEIEEKLLEIPEVFEVAAVGVPDEVLGEAIKVFVVLKQGENISEAEFLKKAQKVLPAYKMPKYVQFVGELPKSSAGKILKHKLKSEYHD